MIQLFTHLGFQGNIIPYLLEFRFYHQVFFKVIDCKKIARDKVNPIIMTTYCAVNAIDEATINLPGFVLAAVDSALPEGAFPGSSSGTWINGFHIERLAL